MQKHISAEVRMPEADKDKAEISATKMIDAIIAKETAEITSRSDMTHAYEGEWHRFRVDIEIKETA
jgi:hypothetical protein